MEGLLEGATLSVYLLNAQISSRAGYCTNTQVSDAISGLIT